MSKARHRAWEGWLFVSPAVLGWLLLSIGPALACLGLGFTRWDTFTSPQWIGLANFRKLLNDPLFWQSVRVTLSYSIVAVPLGLAFALALALLVNQRLRGVSIYRLLFFMPNIVAGVAMLLVWKWMFQPDFGALNLLFRFSRFQWVLNQFGIGTPQWIYARNSALPSLMLMSLAGVGGSMMILLAGLQNIPEQLHEAALLDGANRFQRLRHITLPMLTPTLFFLSIVGTIGSLQMFSEALVMTEGGPANATLFYGLYLYRTAFELYRMGYACAMAALLFCCILGLTLLQWKLSAKWVHYT